MYIENINLPKDIKKLSVEQLSVLAEEVRTALIRKLSEHGGHIESWYGGNYNCTALCF